MARVELDVALLSLGSDLTQVIPLYVTSVEDERSGVVETRRYANGTRRVVTRQGRDRTVNLDFECDRADLGVLAGWIGLRVLYRDPFGRKMWCTFAQLPVAETIPVDFPIASLVLRELTFSEVA